MTLAAIQFHPLLLLTLLFIPFFILSCSNNDQTAEFPGTTYPETDNGWQLEIPNELYLGHEAHFGEAAEAYSDYLVEGNLPDLEVPNMITKYYITTQARELAMLNE